VSELRAWKQQIGEEWQNCK